MSKLSEALKHAVNESLGIIERGEMTDDIRADLAERQAKIDRMAQDVAKEAALVSQANAINAMVMPTGIQRFDGAGELTFENFLRSEVERQLGGHIDIINRADVHITDIASTVNQVTGPFMDFVYLAAPVSQSFTNYPMPDSEAFYRQYFGAPSGASAGAQAVDGDTFVEVSFGTSKTLVTSAFSGAYAKLGVRSIEKGDPSAYTIATKELQRALARTIENKSAAALTGAGFTAQTLSLTADAPTIYKAILNAATTVLTNSNRFADVAFLAPDRAAYIGGLCDTTGRPLFPPATGGQQVNGFGQSGVNTVTLPGVSRTVVSPSLPSGHFSVVSSELCEWFFTNRGIKTHPEDVTNGTVTVGINAWTAAQVWTAAGIALAP